MNKKLFNTILFTAGAAIGSLVTWKVVKTKYERIAQEEIDSVKEEYSRLMGLTRKETEPHHNDELEDEADDQEGEDEFSEQEITEYHKIAGNYRVSASETDEEGGNGGDEDEVPYIDGPYVISPEDFANSPPGYSAQPLDYFADGILADGWGVELDIDETIGEDALNHFGEYTDDIVYVRNERTEIDYEVTQDPRTYEEAIRINPNPYYGK